MSRVGHRYYWTLLHACCCRGPRWSPRRSIVRLEKSRLRGTEIDDFLWAEILGTFLKTQGAITVPIDCGAAVFNSKVRMEGLTFTKHAGFFGTIFDDGCEVRNCVFDGGLDIRLASFLGPGYFPNCKATTLYASYCNTQQHVAFASCEFTGKVDAEGVQKDFRLEDCHLHKSCDISHADVDVLILKGSQFDGELKMADINAKSLMSADVKISAPSTIGPLDIAGSADLSNSSFKRQTRPLIVTASTLTLAGSSFGGGGRIDCKKARSTSSPVVSAPLLVIRFRWRCRPYRFRMRTAGTSDFLRSIFRTAISTVVTTYKELF